MSRPDDAPRVGVDFSPPRRANRTRPVLAVVVAVVLIAAAALAVTQLLLR
ncbi:MAG TPA: hypothetical protein VM674_01860 [Candidatus Acidoferrum sp.]|nr:hypothetical protein [Candidatus Acidoferrum sp.]